MILRVYKVPNPGCHNSKNVVKGMQLVSRVCDIRIDTPPPHPPRQKPKHATDSRASTLPRVSKR